MQDLKIEGVAENNVYIQFNFNLPNGVYKFWYFVTEWTGSLNTNTETFQFALRLIKASAIGNSATPGTILHDNVVCTVLTSGATINSSRKPYDLYGREVEITENKLYVDVLQVLGASSTIGFILFYDLVKLK